MQVDVEMAVDVRQGTAGIFTRLIWASISRCSCLCSPLSKKGPPLEWTGLSRKLPAASTRPGILSGQHGRTLDQGQVQTHLEAGIAAGNPHSFVERHLPCDDRGAGQDAPSRLLHCGIDAGERPSRRR